MDIQKKKGISFQLKMTVVLLILTIIPLLASTIFFINYFGGVIKNDNEKFVKESLNSNVLKMQDWVQSKISTVQDLVKNNKAVQTGDPKQVFPILQILEDSDNETEGFSFVDKAGNLTNLSNMKASVATEDYFKKMQEDKQPYISDMTYLAQIKKNIISTIVPIVNKSGEFTGAIMFSTTPDVLTNMSKQVKVLDSGYAYIVSKQGNYFAYSDASRVGKKMMDYAKSEDTKKGYKEILAKNNGSLTYKDEKGKNVISYYSEIPGTSWKLVVTVPKSEFDSEVSEATTVGTIILVSVVILVTILSLLASHHTIKPILRISKVLTKVADGHLTERVDINSKDEIGQMSQDINTMIDSLSGIVSKINDTVTQVAAASIELTESAKLSSNASVQISSAIGEVANGTDTQLLGAEQSAKAMEEMSIGVQKIAESAEMVSEQTDTVTTEVENGYLKVRSAIDQMSVIESTANQTATIVEKLSEHSNEISQIVDVITGISNQTSLLSLNASIEAARAGEQGRGFAVVANEVKQLAEQTKQSLSHISELVEFIKQTSTNAVGSMQTNVSEIQDGIEKMQVVGTSFDHIRSSIHQVSAQTQDVSATTEEISAGSEEITASVEEMLNVAKEAAKNAQSVAASSTEQSQIMQDIAGAAQFLAQMMNDLKEQIKVFKI